MPRFRSAIPASASHQRETLSVDAVRALVADAVKPRHFFAAPGLQIDAVHADAEEVCWEILQGRLLDAPLTTRRETFEAWHVLFTREQVRPTHPVLSIRLDAYGGRLYVTRAIHCHAWEGYHAGDNVYMSRETRKWVRELVGAISLARHADSEGFRDELICLLFHAVVGTSRLPLTSVEAPLPAFSLGELAYVYRPNLHDAKATTLASHNDLIEHALLPELCWLEMAKLLETLLRATPWDRLTESVETWMAQWRSLRHADEEVLALLRTLFNEVALSPYTDLVDKALAFVGELEAQQRITAEAATDFLGHLLRQLGRHLTAYDLVTFHHRGANYPDALFLDAVLKAYLQRIERMPSLFRDAPDDPEPERRVKRMRRRGLRQSWLLRSRYEGHPVPDAPTSEGENARILPAPHIRVPEEQIVQVQRRRKRLFADDPLVTYLHGTNKEVLAQSLTDLHHPDELRELGMALFLDRPMGSGKSVGERDQTLLFSYEAFSRSVAQRRLDYLAVDLMLLNAEAHDRLQALLRDLPVRGVALGSIRLPERLTPVSLADARKVAEDFLFLRNTGRTVKAFLDQYDCQEVVKSLALDFLADGRRVLMLPGCGASDAERAAITIFDESLQPRLRLHVDASEGYESWGACEYPMPGLKVGQAWDATGYEIRNVALSSLVVRPRT